MTNLPNTLHELRIGVRMLLKRPGLAILAAVTFALGIGLTTTMFSIIRGVALRGLPFDHPEQILYIGRVASGQPGVSTVPVDDFLEWRAGQHSFEQLAAFRSAQANMSDRTVPEVSRLAFITSNTLHLLRVAPVVGRDFNDADEQRGAPRVALISYRLWDARYRRDPSVISRTVRVNGVATEIVGVLPERFGFPDTPDLWMPLDLTPAAARGEGQRVDVFGRLKPAVSMAAAATEFRTMSMQSEALHPENRGVQAALMPYTHRFVDPQVVGTLFAMLAAVFGVMLIACVNVANLQLARAAERTRELAIRTALGAGRSRIVRQLLLEGLLLATAGAALGLIVATVGVALFDRAIVDNRPPFWFDIRIDTTVLAFVTLVTVVAALAGSLAPALRATRSDVNAVLKDEGRTNTGLRMGRFSRGLVIAEVLVSCCLLVVSGLMIKSVVTIAHIDYPYATDDVFVASVIASDAYATDGARRRLADRLDAELATIPGTRAIALASGTPEFTSGSQFVVEGRTYASPKDRPPTRRLAVTPHFFDVLHVSMAKGRGFTPADSAGAAPVAIVTDDFARRYFPGTEVIGRRIQLAPFDTSPWLTIVGVVPRLVALRRNVSNRGDTVFTPLAQEPATNLTILASVGGNPTAIAPSVRIALQKVDQDLALSNPRSLAAINWAQTWSYRVFGALFASFGVGALILASAGLYGVTAFSVRSRTQEIGVRMALGATRPSVMRLILWQGMWRVGAGIALGVAPALLLGSAMSDLLFGVTPGDPLVLGVAVSVLSVTGLVASLAPALRAAAVDPSTALRAD